MQGWLWCAHTFSRPKATCFINRRQHLPSSRYARLGRAHTGNLQKRRYTDLLDRNWFHSWGQVIRVACRAVRLVISERHVDFVAPEFLEPLLDSVVPVERSYAASAGPSLGR